MLIEERMLPAFEVRSDNGVRAKAETLVLPYMGLDYVCSFR